MKRLIVAFRNLHSNGTEERNSKIIKIKIWFDAAELVTFIHMPGIKLGRSGSYWPLFVRVEAGRSVAWQTDKQKDICSFDCVDKKKITPNIGTDI
jgi:hypothetical protein